MTETSTLTVDQALAAIVSWANKRPRWMSAALISLANDSLNDEELERIAGVAVAEFEGDDSQPYIELTDLLGSTSSTPTVRIRHIDQVQNVNRLAAKQSLVFDPDGISIVYGQNGSGKSGYTRILKQVGRVRGGALPVLSDVYAEVVGTTSADIAWRTDSSDGVHAWSASSPSVSELEHVHVFDAHAASNAVRDASAAPFVPFPVRLVEGLGAAIVAVRDILTRKTETFRGRLPVIPGLSQDSVLIDQINRLGLDLDVEAFIAANALNPEEKIELLKLTKEAAELVNVNVVNATIVLGERFAEFENFESAIVAVGSKLNADTIIQTRSAGAKMRDARTAADVSSKLLAGQGLDGVGSDQWKMMWEKARQYSEFLAYPGEKFPHIGDSALCVLCEQTLSPVAATRMTTLERFVSDSSQSELEILKADHRSWQVENLPLADQPHFEVSEELATLASELEVDLVKLSERVVSETKSLLGEHDRIRAGLSYSVDLVQTKTSNEVRALDWDRTQIHQALGVIRTDLEAKKRALADSQDENKRRSSTERSNVLLERETVTAAAPELKEQHILMSSITASDGARATCTTNASTELSGRLSQALITETLRTALAGELVELGADHLVVSVDKGTAKAVSVFRLKLSTVSGDALVGDVLSEGELRVLGLAAFLMEISSSGGRSAIVLDDPVSSLDHVFRERVAKRIAAEAKERQVIVFTHDLVFLDELAEACRDAGIQPSISAIKSTKFGTGVNSIDVPAAGGSFDTQLKHIARSIDICKSIWDEHDAETWEPESRRICVDLRNAWERGIEEVLFSKTVSRFRASIMTSRLREVEVADDHWSEIESAMTELSGRGPHDAATAQRRSPLTHAELSAGLERLRRWKSAVSSSRKQTLARRNALRPKSTP